MNRTRTARRRILAGVALAALLVAGAPLAAQGLWGANGTAALTLTAAPFGATSSTPTVMSSSITQTSPYTGTVEILFPVAAATGSAAWTAAKGEVTGTGPVGSSGASVAVSGYATTAGGTCSGVTYAGAGTSAALPGLVGLANAQSRAVCVRLSITGLSAASNNTSAQIGLTVTAAAGPSSVNGTGWTAAAPHRSLNVFLPIAPAAGDAAVTCQDAGAGNVLLSVTPARNGPFALSLSAAPESAILYDDTPAPVTAYPVEAWAMWGMPGGAYSLYLIGMDAGPQGTVWGSVEVTYVENIGLSCGEVN